VNQHQVCRRDVLQHGLSESGSAGLGSPPSEICVIDRLLDPSGPGPSGETNAFRSLDSVERVRYESGHRPLTGIAAVGGQDVYSPHQICDVLDSSDD
jgi:hypothetical protein